MSNIAIKGFSLKKTTTAGSRAPSKSAFDQDPRVPGGDATSLSPLAPNDKLGRLERFDDYSKRSSLSPADEKPPSQGDGAKIENEADDKNEDDYLAMTFEDTRPETSLQRAAREKRERWERAHPPSKAELHAQHRAELEKGLSTKIDDTNKGAQMLKRMGFKGGALGATGDAAAEPLVVSIKTGRAGIGVSSEKKRPALDSSAQDVKRPKVDFDDFRNQVKAEKDEKRAECQFYKAMRTLEDLHERDIAAQRGATEADNVHIDKRPLYRVPLLYRHLIQQRRETEENRRLEARSAMGRLHDRRFDGEEYEQEDQTAEVQEAIEDDRDEELEEFMALPVSERRDRVVEELRTQYCYCMWCGHRYKDKDELNEDCPGISEDDHDV